jgi:hypothetical protein
MGKGPISNISVIVARVNTLPSQSLMTLARQADEDAEALGLPNRSAAVREGLRLLHRRARQVALERDYDDFYQVRRLRSAR